MFHGLSDIESVEPDHRLFMSLNNSFISTSGEIAWDGREIASFLLEGTSGLSHGNLNDGDNTLSFLNIAEIEIDRVYVNWIELSYSRLFKAINNQLVFRKPDRLGNGLYQFTISDFKTPDITVYKKHVSKIVNIEIRPVIVPDASGRRVIDSYRVIFQDDAGHRPGDEGLWSFGLPKPRT